MTPEGYEEAGMAEAEFTPTKGETNNQGHKTTAKLKTSASNKQDSNDHPLKGIETRLPEPQYRTVAGHVSRRANTSAAADPPPPPPAPIRATSSNQRRKKRRKTDDGGLGDDSDDSDSGDQKPGQGNDTPSASSRRRRPRAQNDPEPTSAGVSSRPFESLQSKPLHFSWEEQKRLDLRHELSIISSIWENIMPLRDQNSKQAAERKLQMLKYAFGSDSLSWVLANQDCDDRLDEYLEHSLHQAAIEGITHNVHSVMQLTHRFIRELEKEVIRQCEAGDHGPYLEYALPRIKSLLVSEPVIGETTDLNIDTWSGAISIFVEALIGKFKSSFEEICGSKRPSQFSLLDRKRRRITIAYMEWLCEDVDIDSIQECPVELLNGLRAMQRLKTLREGTWQTFICRSENVHGISSLRVSLAMFKSNQPLRIQTVSPSKLSQMGWILDAHTPSFWRSLLLEATIAGEKETKKAVFKVDMDGAVLAIQRPDGQWLDWKDIEGGE